MKNPHFDAVALVLWPCQDKGAMKLKDVENAVLDAAETAITQEVVLLVCLHPGALRQGSGELAAHVPWRAT